MSTHNIANSNRSLSNRLYVLYNQDLLSRQRVFSFIEKKPTYIVSDTGSILEVNDYEFRLLDTPYNYSQPRKGVMIQNIEVV